MLMRFSSRGPVPMSLARRPPCPASIQEAIRKNFILVYELLDETLDYGYPQGTSTETLRHHVRSDPILVDSVKSLRLPAVSAATPFPHPRSPSSPLLLRRLDRGAYAVLGFLVAG